MIVRVKVVLNRTVVVDSDCCSDNIIYAVVIFSVKVSCITSLMVLNSAYGPDWSIKW